MAKRPASKRPARPRAPLPRQVPGGDRYVLNRTLNQQTRKVLGKHYRAKYGVK